MFCVIDNFLLLVSVDTDAAAAGDDDTAAFSEEIAIDNGSSNTALEFGGDGGSGGEVTPSASGTGAFSTSIGCCCKCHLASGANISAEIGATTPRCSGSNADAQK